MDYFILKPNGEQTGTYSIDQIRAMLKTGFVGPDTCYWHEGITEWQPIDRIEESLNLPAPSSESHERAVPPPYRLSGSLARAIPSPHQQKRPSTPAGMEPVAPENARPPAPVFGPAEAPGIPAPTAVPYLNGKTSPAPVRPAPAEDAAVTPAAADKIIPEYHPPRSKPRRWKLPVSAGYWLYALPAVLVALAIIGAIVASRHPARSPLSKVTLTSQNVYVLINQADIKAFEDDMRTSAVAAALVRQMAQSNDPVFIQRMAIGLQKENAQHRVEVTQHYLESGKAKFIEPGLYTALSYFDDSGAITVPRAGEPWVAILYRGNVVFAYQGTEFILKSQ